MVYRNRITGTGSNLSWIKTLSRQNDRQRFKYEVAKGYPKSCKKSRMNRNDRKKENGNEAVNQMEKILVKIEKKKWEEQIKCYNCGKRGHTQKECRRFCFKSGGK